MASGAGVIVKGCGISIYHRIDTPIDRHVAPSCRYIRALFEAMRTRIAGEGGESGALFQERLRLFER
jgi:hypothetical protein